MPADIALSHRQFVEVRHRAGAFKTAQPEGAWHLPVTAEQCDAYLASLSMAAANSGTKMGYNNYG